MESRNPILNRSGAFNGQAGSQYGQQSYSAGGQGYQGYGQVPPPPPGYSDPSTWQTGGPGTPVATERMTLDSVISRTGATLLTVITVAAVTWMILPDGSDGGSNYLPVALIGGMVGGLALGLTLSFMRRSLPAPLVLAYAAAQGLFIGAISEILNDRYDGVVVGAVLGTVGAFAATLTAYKVFNIRVSAKFQKFVIIFGLGFAAVTLMDVVLYMFGAEIGINGFGPLGLIMSFVGLALGILYLILDFNMIEQGIAHGVPEGESWRAAFALTATLVLIYIELLRILSILQSD